ncbi:MAG: DUF1761 domain-containing protein [Gemmatimonadaceae bacterium]
MAELHVNWLAVLVSGVAAYALAMLWCSPLMFAKAWVAAHGYTAEQRAEMQAGAGEAYTITFACWLLMSAGMGVRLHRLDTPNMMSGLKAALLAWGAFAVPVGLSQYAFSGQPMSAWAIDAGYQLVSLVLMGAVLAKWWQGGERTSWPRAVARRAARAA